MSSGAEKISDLSSKQILLILTGLSILYFGIWIYFAYPYSLIPSDDFPYFRKIQENGFPDRIYYLLTDHNPILNLSLAVIDLLWSKFSLHPQSILSFHSVFSGSLILFLGGWIIFRLTEKPAAVFLFALIYGTSAWPANYYFYWSYTSFATLLFLIAFTLVIESFFQETNERASFYLVALAGVFTGLLFWTSPSAPLPIFLLVLFFNFYLKSSGIKNLILKNAAFFLPAFLVLLLYLDTSATHWIDHLLENSEENYYVKLAAEKGNPSIPFFTFFKIVNTYNPALQALFLVALTLAVGTYAMRVKSNLSTHIKFMAGLSAFFFAHALAIDLLPFTKLGRSHFLAYPFFLILTILLCYYVQRTLAKKFKTYSLILFSFLVIFSVTQNVLFSSDMVNSKQTASLFLKKTTAFYDTIHLLGEKDPHIYAYTYAVGFIPHYLHSTRIKHVEVGVEEFSDILKDRKKVALLVGPHGKNSGNSILYHSSLPDYPFDEEQFLKSMPMPFSERITLPYYAYFPSFMMEEELSQALYFSGRIPDHRDPSKNLTLYLW